MVAHLGTRFPTAPASAGRSLPATYQTRICDFQGIDPNAGEDLLSAYAVVYGRKERRLFAEMAASRPAQSLKGEYLRRYRIPARMFNGVRVSLEGKVASPREQQQLQLDSLKRRIVRAESQMARGRSVVRRD